MRRILLGIAGLLLAAAIASAQRDAGLTAGDLAPDFALEATDGRTIRLSDLTRRHVVVLVFWHRG